MSVASSFAANTLLERHPEVADRFAPRAFPAWKDFLTRRVRELAAAAYVGDPRVFAESVAWERQAFSMRSACPASKA